MVNNKNNLAQMGRNKKKFQEFVFCLMLCVYAKLIGWCVWYELNKTDSGWTWNTETLQILTKLGKP